MSNVIKAGSYSQGKQPVVLMLQIPLIETGCTTKEMIAKTKEELIELLWEVTEGDIDKQAALSEMFDVVQVMLGLIIASAKDVLNSDEDAYEYAVNFFEKCDQAHIEKMNLYTIERSWKAITT